MKIRGKILVSLLSIFAFLIGTIGITFLATTRIAYFHAKSLEVEAELLAATALRAQVRNQLLETFDSLYLSGLASSEGQMEKGKRDIQEKIAAMDAIAGKNGQKTAGEDAESKQFLRDLEEVKHSYASLQTELDRAVDFVRAGNHASAHQILIDARKNKFQNSFIKEITEVIDNRKAMSRERSQTLEKSMTQLKFSLACAAALALLLIFCLATFVSRSIGRRLMGIESAAASVAGGNLDISVDENGKDEVAHLAKAMNHMADSLKAARSDIQKQQELLVVSSKMSSLGEMAGGIAHEINNPLAVIGMRAEQIKDLCDSEPLDASIVKASCDVVIATCDRIAKIVAGLRAFARDGRADPFEPSDLRKIIGDTLSFCRQKFAHSQIKLEIALPEKSPAFECRPTQISQVLLNLLSNSFDAVLPLPDKWIRIEGRVNAENLEISVTDGGKGIPAEIRTKLLQPFFTTKEVGKGTGLGLSICRGIAESHGGTLYLDPASANTRFVVVIPLRQNRAQQPEPIAS